MEEYKRITINFYNQHVDQYIEKTKDLQEKDWISKFVQLLPNKGRVLDMGCAFGRDTVTFIEKGFEVQGVDLSERLIRKARERIPETMFVLSDIECMPFENQRFDGVWCNATITHIRRENLQNMFAEMNRVLKPGGILYVNAKRGKEQGIIQDDRYGGAKKFHSKITLDELKEFLANANFSVIESLDAGKLYEYDNAGLIFSIARKKAE